MSKQNLKLSKEKETLLVPLYCKAKEYERENSIIKDKKAKDIINNIEYDFKKLDIPYKTCITLNIRAQKIDEYVNKFISDHKEVTVIHLGCGLDNRYGRIDNENVNFYDLDFKKVIDIKKNFYQDTDNYHFISSSVTDLNWLKQIDDNAKTIIVAEGLFMYIEEKQLKILFHELQKHFPGAHLIFDAYSTYTVKNIGKHASIKKTQAEIKWGIDDPREIEDWHRNISFVKEWFFTDYDKKENLSTLFKFSFKAAGLFKMAKKAHRILYYKFEKG